MKKIAEPKKKLTDEERHKRFVETAREVEASEKPADFDKAFEKIAAKQPSKSETKKHS